jgi:hypothetical protein
MNIHVTLTCVDVRMSTLTNVLQNWALLDFCWVYSRRRALCQYPWYYECVRFGCVDVRSEKASVGLLVKKCGMYAPVMALRHFVWTNERSSASKARWLQSKARSCMVHGKRVPCWWNDRLLSAQKLAMLPIILWWQFFLKLNRLTLTRSQIVKLLLLPLLLVWLKWCRLQYDIWTRLI